MSRMSVKYVFDPIKGEQFKSFTTQAVMTPEPEVFIPRVLADGSIERDPSIAKDPSKLYFFANGVEYIMPAEIQTQQETAWTEAAPILDEENQKQALLDQLNANKLSLEKIQLEYEFYLAQLAPTSAKLLAMATDHSVLYNLMSKGAVETAYAYLQAMTPDTAFSAEDIAFFKSLFLEYFPQLAALG